MRHHKRHRLVRLALGLCCLLWASAPLRAAEVSAVPARPAPKLQLQDLEGAIHRLAEYRGRVVLLNFWASWCTPCLREMPSLQRLAESLTEKPFSLLAVNMAESQKRAAQSVRRLGYRLPVLLDPQGDVFHQWGGRMLPTSYILDRRGNIRYRILGDAEWDNDAEIAEILQALIAESDQSSR